jgi:hypothetical protein
LFVPPDVSIDAWCGAVLEAIAAHEVGDRPDCFEHRLRKRRGKPYKHLREPRGNARRIRTHLTAKMLAENGPTPNRLL